jgi:tetratricopeptide (TPR) repeat protein
MSSCPSNGDLHALLDEDLVAAVEARVVAHVESCRRCQDRLDGLTSCVDLRSSWLLLADSGMLAEPDCPPPAWRPEVPMGPGDRPERPPDTEPDLTANPAFTSDVARHDDSTPTDRECPACRAATDIFTGITSETRNAERIHPDPTESAADDDESDLDPERTLSPIGISPWPAPLRPEGRQKGWPEIPGYEVIGKLGEGGMGIVYKARQRGLNRLVAVKMIVGGKQAQVDHLARFRVEAEAVARLRHPNILQIYDIGEVDGSPFLSLELLEGGDLDDRLTGRPQPGQPGARLVSTLARAVQAAHQAGIIHRDLKPSNILFNDEGIPKITDFGLAKRLESDSRQTETGQILGTPSYMAPEQARGHTKDVGPAADTYALGAILYQVLTGRPPFMGETPMETLRQVIADDPVPPSRLVPRLPRDLETICLKCLQKEPRKRYASAQDLADDLDRYGSGNTIKARRTPVWERGWKWSRRRPLAAMAVAASIVTVVGLIGWRMENERRDRLQMQRLDLELDRYQTRGMELADFADKARTREELETILGKLGTFHPNVEADPRLRLISSHVEQKKQRVADRLGDLNTREAAHTQFQRFLDLRQEAQWYAVGFEGLDPTDRQWELRSVSLAALREYGVELAAGNDAPTVFKPLPHALSEAEQSRVREGCYDLLLLLSQAAEPKEGLRILDQAARLRPLPTAAYHLRRAECLERAGDRASRDREIQSARQLPPSTPLDYFLNGRELVIRHDFAEAIRSLDRVIQLDPDQPSAHFLLAVCDLLTQPKRLSEAIGNLNTCIRANPRVVGLYLMRASASGEEASQAQEKAVAGATSGPEADRSRRAAVEAFDAAEDDLGRALAMNPNNELRYVLLTQRGLLRLQADRLDEATADLDVAIGLQPTAYQAHTTLAQVLRRKGRLDDAFAAFGRAIACDPEPTILARLFRSRALLHASRPGITPAQQDSALQDLAEAIRRELDGNLKAADHVSRARLFFRAHRAAEALADCDSAIALVPQDPDAHRVRIATLMELKRYDAVLASADAYLARGKPIAEILEIRGLARVARKDYAGAIADFNRALDQTPSTDPPQRSRLLNRRGWAYQYADAPRLARSDFEESLRLEPNQSDAYSGRGLARIRLGEWRPAVADAEAAIRQARETRVGSTSEDAAAAQVQASFNATRIYAQAIEFAARDVSREGERSVSLYRRYRTRALELLDEALRGEQDPARRSEILNDPALRPLRLRTAPRPAARGNIKIGQAFQPDGVGQAFQPDSSGSRSRTSG